MLKEAALTMQQGGGIGYDFSTIRPKGAAVHGVAADASGPLLVHGCVGRDVPHHHVGGQSRRGPAMMATMRCDHPDILEDFDQPQDGRDLLGDGVGRRPILGQSRDARTPAHVQPVGCW